MMTLTIESKNIQALHYQLLSEKTKSIAVVGVTREVGTTSISYALARRFAASGTKTVLIDLDRVGHAISSQLACIREDWTPETTGLSKLVKPMGRTGLSVLSAPSSKLLHWSFKERLIIESMLRDLGNDYDMIVIDAGAVINDQERSIPTEVIAAAADVCVPVILSGKTNEIHIAKSQKILEGQGSNLPGYVMNDYKNPPLSEELERTVKRFEKWSPKLIGWTAQAIKNKVFLSQII
jgi:Mrp family chromosome partitioning ATPase